MERDCRETGGLNYGSGHVAYVEQVLSPVRFRVSEKGRSPGRGARARRTAMAYTEEGVSFIYETVHVRPRSDNSDPDTGEDPGANGTPVIQGDPQVGSNQRWHFVPEGDYFRIVAAYSGKCLDVYRASLHSRADIVQWDCHAASNQLWRRVPQGDDYVLIAKHGGRSLDVLGHDDPTSQTEDGSRWRLIPDDQHYRITAEGTDRCLDVTDSLWSNGAAVVLWDCNGGDNQLWKLLAVGDYFRIVAKHSGKCLDVSEASYSNGAAIIRWDCNGGDNQLWKLFSDGGRFALVAKHSGKCLDVRGDSLSNGASLVQWGCPSEPN